MAAARGAGRRLWVGLLVVLILLGVQFVAPASGILDNAEALALDVRFRLRGPMAPGDSVVIVRIDERSIQKLGRWPWSRQLYAELVDKLAAAGASVIAFDVLFTEPGAPEADRALADAMRRAGNVVLPVFIATNVQTAARAGRPPVQSATLDRSAYKVYRTEAASGGPRVPLAGPNLILPINTLLDAAAGVGHVNFETGPAGSAQFESVAVGAGGALYPSLAVAVAQRYLKLSADQLRLDVGSDLLVGPIDVPLDLASRLPVNWRGPRGTMPSVSLADVLDGTVPVSIFQDRAVLVGGDAVGVGSTVRSPFDPALPAIERQATVVNSILQIDFLLRDQLTDGVDLVLVLGGGALAAVVGALAAPLWGAVLALALTAAVAALVILAFTAANLWLSFVVPTATPLMVYGVVSLNSYFRQHRDARRIQAAFSHYLHPALVDRLVQDPTALGPSGERRELTVLFSDIRGFSGIAERMSPERLVGFMTDYLSAMTEIVLDERGLLDKYIGDGIMAVYGAPMALPDHAYRACRTALRMVDAVEAQPERWRRWGVEALRIGVGINTGPMIVGNIGSVDRFEYTVLGDEVNIGARLEGLTKSVGDRVILSEATWRLVRDRIACDDLGATAVPGRAAPVRIFAARKILD
ncbi:MAG TPA: adenylate/guanylate cyclase domain-containing protein [Alphaproteobacteria bacterium]|jgi:adenylate cyclase|nr:adenylate/guanylate cyclase domain-containing protein [Alphaproteobacteria bacterium]